MQRARFIALWERCLRNGTGTDARRVYEGLRAHYSEPHRCYHTPAHLNHCLRQFDLADSLMDDPDAVEMAIWFHDVIYNVPTTDNELKSAQYFTELARGRADSGFCQNVYNMILTTTHQQLPTRKDDKYLVDVDLSSFGLPWDEFRRDSVSVRDEFADRPDREFYNAHIKFMQSLIARRHFFATEFFRKKYEKSARDNVERLIEELRSAGFA